MTGKLVVLILSSGTAFLGIIFLIVIIIAKKVEKQKQEKCTQKVEATIVDVIEERSINSDDIMTYPFPVYEYQYHNETFRTTASIGSVQKKYEIGKKEEIYIDPSNPKNIYLKDKETMTKIIKVFTYTTIALLVLSIVFFIFWMNI